MLATFTFKQAIVGDDGTWTPATRERCTSTCWLVRDRVGKALLPRSAYRAGQRVKTLAFIEGGDGVKRWHAHLCFAVPPGIPAAEFEARARGATARLDWLRPEMDFRTIRPGSLPRALAYLVKEGEGAFAPEASCV